MPGWTQSPDSNPRHCLSTFSCFAVRHACDVTRWFFSKPSFIKCKHLLWRFFKHTCNIQNISTSKSLQAPCTQLQQGVVYGPQHPFCTPASPNCAGLMGPPDSVPGQNSSF